MLDFTNCEINKFKYYGGKNGGKICIKYDNEDYMLKFPGINEGISEHGYSNNCLSEYVACNIIRILGLKVQDVLLGLYNLNGSEKIVVACKDFTSDGTVLKQFAELIASLPFPPAPRPPRPGRLLQSLNHFFSPFPPGRL